MGGIVYLVEKAYHLKQNTFPRDDYKKLNELIVVYLGGEVPGGFNAKRKGAMHEALWNLLNYSIAVTAPANGLSFFQDMLCSGYQNLMILTLPGLVLKLLSQCIDIPAT